MRDAVAAFLLHLDRERNASPHTQRAYAQDLHQFREHLREELGREGRPKDVDHLLIRSFLARLHRQGLKKVSAARKLASLRTFFRFLCRQGALERNPAMRDALFNLALVREALAKSRGQVQGGAQAQAPDGSMFGEDVFLVVVVSP